VPSVSGVRHYSPFEMPGSTHPATKHHIPEDKFSVTPLGEPQTLQCDIATAMIFYMPQIILKEKIRIIKKKKPVPL
jgi:hypothetical protein